MPTYKSSSPYHDAEYNFSSQSVGDTTITGWTQEGGNNAEVVREVTGHVKVLQLPYTAGPTQTDITRAFGAAKDSGAVEFWSPRTDVGTGSANLAAIHVTFEASDDSVCCGIKIESASIKNWADAEITSVSIQGAHHFAILFNNTGGDNLDAGDGDATLDDGNYRVYVNGTKYGDYAMTNAQDADQLRITSETLPV
jgi:hypothetical protein